MQQHQQAHHKTVEIHVSLVKPGDTVMYRGQMRTVSKSNMSHDPFMGHKLFGDNFMCGLEPVSLVVFPRFYQGKQVNPAFN